MQQIIAVPLFAKPSHCSHSHRFIKIHKSKLLFTYHTNTTEDHYGQRKTDTRVDPYYLWRCIQHI